MPDQPQPGGTQPCETAGPARPGPGPRADAVRPAGEPPFIPGQVPHRRPRWPPIGDAVAPVLGNGRMMLLPSCPLLKAPGLVGLVRGTALLTQCVGHDLVHHRVVGRLVMLE